MQQTYCNNYDGDFVAMDMVEMKTPELSRFISPPTEMRVLLVLI